MVIGDFLYGIMLRRNGAVQEDFGESLDEGIATAAGDGAFYAAVARRMVKAAGSWKFQVVTICSDKNGHEKGSHYQLLFSSFQCHRRASGIGIRRAPAPVWMGSGRTHEILGYGQ